MVKLYFWKISYIDDLFRESCSVFDIAFGNLKCFQNCFHCFWSKRPHVKQFDARLILALKGEAQTTGWKTHDIYMSLCVSCVVKRYRVIHLVDCRCFGDLVCRCLRLCLHLAWCFDPRKFSKGSSKYLGDTLTW